MLAGVCLCEKFLGVRYIFRCLRIGKLLSLLKCEYKVSFLSISIQMSMGMFHIFFPREDSKHWAGPGVKEQRQKGGES